MTSHRHFSLGIVLCIALLMAVILLSDGRALMFNLEGLAVVIGGTIGATLISYPREEISVAVKVVINSYRSKVPSEKEIVDSLLDLSMKSRLDGLLALEKQGEHTSFLFLKRALTMLVDGFNLDELREALYTEMHFFRQRRSLHERIFRHMALLAPAFGVAGGVIGLIGMLAGVSNDTSVILHTIPVALTSTLYGILLAYFLCIPIAENLFTRTEQELLIQKLITEGVVLIGQEYNTVRLQTQLQSFITPQLRNVQNKTIHEIHDRYEKIKSGKMVPDSSETL